MSQKVYVMKFYPQFATNNSNINFLFNLIFNYRQADEFADKCKVAWMRISTSEFKVMVLDDELLDGLRIC